MKENNKQADRKFSSFEDFYPFYLGEHKNLINRRLHWLGTTFVIIIAFFAFILSQPSLLYYAPFCGYGFAWTGHFFFEKNKPATFKYPIYSLIGDFRMWYQITTGVLKM